MKGLLSATALVTVWSGLALSLGTAAQAADQPVSNPEMQAAQVAQADTGIEEVVVSARRRKENLQTVPVAATVLTQSDLGNRGNFGIADLAQQVPNLNFFNQSGSRSDVVLAIRGQGKVYGGRFPSTIVYFSDVPILKITNGQFYDLDSIQILRGPQGTLFGRVTDGGNVMLVPKKPTNEYGGYVEATGGSYGLFGVTGAVNIPIVDDKVLLRGAFDIKRRGGYTLNLLTGKHLDDIHYDFFRASLVWKPINHLENDTIFSFNQGNSNGSSNEIAFVNQPMVTAVETGTAASFGLPPATAAALGQQTGSDLAAALAAQRARGPRVTNEGSLNWGPNGGIYDKRHDIYVINTTTWNPTDNFQIKNILGYVRVKDHWGADYDGSTVAIIDEGNPLYPHYDFNYKQYSEEFQVQGMAFEKLHYTAGVYWDMQQTAFPSENNTVDLQVINRIDVQYETTTSKAAYGQVEYDLGDFVSGLRLDAGIRYTKDKTEADNASEFGLWDPTNAFGFGVFGIDSLPHARCNASNGCTHGVTGSSAVTYTAGLNEQLTNNVMVYGKVSRGYRPGGINSVSGGLGNATYGPEYDRSLEFGVKSEYEIGNVHARTNLALFNDRYTEIQKLVDIIGANGTPFSVITNAPNARIRGIELEQTVVPAEGLVLGVNWAYTQAKYEKQDPAAEALACYDPWIGFCTQNRFQATPLNALTVSAHYTLPLDASIGDVTVGGNMYRRSSEPAGDTSFFDPHWIMPGYTVFNLDATWGNIFQSQFDLRFFVTNITNKVYETGTTSIEHNLGFAAAQYGEPRMFGFSLRYTFGQGG